MTIMVDEKSDLMAIVRVRKPRDDCSWNVSLQIVANFPRINDPFKVLCLLVYIYWGLRIKREVKGA